MINSYSGKFNQQELVVGTNHIINVKSFSVGLVILRCKEDIGSLKLCVAKGSGVHFIVKGINQVLQITAEVEADSQFTLTCLGELAYQHKLEVIINLIGKNSRANLQVPMIMLKQGQANFSFIMQHLAIRTQGRIVARRVQKDSSISNLLGKLLISNNGRNSDTYLSDKTVLLSPLAKAVSKPELEILADDVKASHGATIGQLSAEEIFYLRSRGLTKNKAKKLLLAAFLNPALIGVPLDIRTELLHDV